MHMLQRDFIDDVDVYAILDSRISLVITKMKVVLDFQGGCFQGVELPESRLKLREQAACRGVRVDPSVGDCYFHRLR